MHTQRVQTRSYHIDKTAAKPANLFCHSIPVPYIYNYTFVLRYSPNMAHTQIRTISFKVRLIDEEGRQVEVRRFGITVDSDAITSFSLLRSKLQAIFPLLHASFFKVSWKDGEGDEIIISSSEELAEAMSVDEICKLRVTLVRAEGTNEVQEENTEAAAPTINLHRNVLCDICDAEIVGTRFKCLQCDDFDLCRGCEATGIHYEHAMLRVVKPIDFKKVHKFRRFCDLARVMFRDFDEQTSRCSRERNAAADMDGQAFMMLKFKDALEKLLSPLDCDLLLYGGDNPEPTVLFSTNNTGSHLASAAASHENSAGPSGGQTNASAAEQHQKQTTPAASSSSDSGDQASGVSSTEGAHNPEVAPPSTSESEQAEIASSSQLNPEQEVSQTEQKPSGVSDKCFRSVRDPRITPEMMQHMQQMLKDKQTATGPVHSQSSSSSTQPQQTSEYSGTSRWEQPTEEVRPANPMFTTNRQQNVANQTQVFNEPSYGPMYPILPTPAASAFNFGSAIAPPPASIFGLGPVTSASNGLGTNFGSARTAVAPAFTFGTAPAPRFGSSFGPAVVAPATSASSTLGFGATPVSSSSSGFGHQFGQTEATPVNMTRGPPGTSSSVFLPSPAFPFGINTSSVTRGTFGTGYPTAAHGAAPFMQQISRAGNETQGVHITNGAAPTAFSQRIGSTNPFRQHAMLDSRQYRNALTQLNNLPEPLIPVPAPVQPVQQRLPEQRQVQPIAPASRHLTPEERSEALVWCAVERMVEMGFSNDDGRLFHVLQLVDGNIDRAIERLTNPSCL